MNAIGWKRNHERLGFITAVKDYDANNVVINYLKNNIIILRRISVKEKSEKVSGKMMYTLIYGNHIGRYFLYSLFSLQIYK